jgi:hypothetical protein
MNTKDWSEWTDSRAVYRRAGGRRRYNAIRRLRAECRRVKLARLCLKYYPDYPPLARGLQTRLAAELGVSRSTISRDLAYLFRRHNP